VTENRDKKTNGSSGGAFLSHEETLRSLVGLVDELEARYAELLDAVEAHESAMRSADVDAMASCVARGNEAVQAIAKLDARRAEIVALHRRSGGGEKGAGEGATVTSIAHTIGGEGGGRLAKRAAELRSLIAKVRTRTEALQQAAEMLSAHTGGILRQVVQMLNHAQVYSRGGSVGAGPKVTSALDVTS